ncbi:hypothetical protein BJ322DRAFT_1109693 [Thelephora terrestris]|uniref:NB-ARC domain-containing protein n=1 Tax=Thelephora terrestris TaxID=56493 RepID=A0A9P6HC87_9AGAM|nr:hypothetical protein BJ322DRAFT_1109693 [Thelephora terrestris]
MGRDDHLSSLNAAIDALDLARDAITSKPAKDAFGPAIVLLTSIKGSMINKPDCVELGLICADAYQVLARRVSESQAGQPSQAALKGINQLSMTVTEIQRQIVEWGKRNPISQHLHKKDDKKAISTWRSDLERFRRDLEARTFASTEFAIDTDVNIPGVHHSVSNTHPAVPKDVLNAGIVIPEARHDASSTNMAISTDHQNAAGTHPAIPEVRYHARTSIYHNTLNGHEKTYASAPGESPAPPPRVISGSIPDIHSNVLKTRTAVSRLQGEIEEMHRALKMTTPQTQNSVSGESPPRPPRIFFGRHELIEKIVGFAEHLTPVALTGAGGIGKTSIALTVLHDDRIKQRFGDDRRFIRCDQFPASLTHFLRRLSEVIGASVENPHGLVSLRPFLSSKEILIVLDNAESILDPQGHHSDEVYSAIEELSEFSNIWLFITSRISIIPSNCKTLEVPTLSREAACSAFYHIYDHGKQSDSANNILETLDFHPLSITLLATVAHQSKRGIDRLTREWENRRTGELGLGARELLGVVAFFPQGVDERNLDWFFPAISNRDVIFDKFCILSLAYRSEGFIKMLAPLRDYLSPKDPLSSPLLCMTKDCYFTRLSIPLDPEGPDFGEARWIASEDVNVEYLLDVLTSIDPDTVNVWGTCASFMDLLQWYKPRHIILGPKIERLPDDHPSKPGCLFRLSTLARLVGDCLGNERLLAHALELWRDRGDLHSVAVTLLNSGCVTRSLTLEEQVQRAEEALKIFKDLKDSVGQARCLAQLAELLRRNDQLDAAEETASRAITLLPENIEQLEACRCHRGLGNVYLTMGNWEKATEHFEVALGIASSHDWDEEAFRSHHSLASVFFQEQRFDEANTHLERAKLRAVNNVLWLAQLMELQAEVWYCEGRLEQAASEVSRAADTFQKLGREEDVGDCRQVLSMIMAAMSKAPFSDGPDPNGEF